MISLFRQQIKKTTLGIEMLGKRTKLNEYHTITELLWKNKPCSFCYKPIEDLNFNETSEVIYAVDKHGQVLCYSKI